MLRVALLALTALLDAWVWQSGHHFTALVLAGLLLFQTLSLARYVERGNHELKSFLESIRYSDFSRTFPVSGAGKSFDELRETFNNVMEDFQKIRSQKEEHYHYLKNILEHVDVAILALRSDGTLEMVNKSAKLLLRTPVLRKLDDLAPFSAELVETLRELGPRSKALVKVRDEDELLQLSIHASIFRLNEREIKLVSLKDIQSEMEAQELEAWQKLIRVLTHEIMNSIAPISSLASTTRGMVEEHARALAELVPGKFDPEDLDDIHKALETINKRSVGLIHFVDTYRNLTRVPKPNLNYFPVRELLEDVAALLAPEVAEAAARLELRIDDPQELVLADKQLLEQVLINLVKNSLQALNGREGAKVELRCLRNRRQRTVIQVVDNGQGILPEAMDMIFIPFFTTKPKGSGIGLSLAKQIMRLHGGSIGVVSVPDRETVFSLTL